MDLLADRVDCWEGLPYKGYSPLWQSPPSVLFGLLILLEAGGEGLLGRHGVAQVVINRVNDKKQRYGKTLHSVILRKRQFSCFNPSGLEQAIKALSTVSVDLIAMATSFIAGSLTCPIVEGATHYLNPKVAHFNNPKDDWTKSHKMEKIVIIGHHVFYEEGM